MKRYIFFIAALLSALFATAQTEHCDGASGLVRDAVNAFEGDTFELNGTLSGNATYEYTASYSIDLLSGFNYLPKSGCHGEFSSDDIFAIHSPESGITGPSYPNGDVGNGVVGGIAGSIDVSALGGAIYSVPVQMPPGINNLQPNIAITYNSQSGNGLLGWGWNLSGTSSISRTGKTVYHDGAAGHESFAESRFVLDGQRLMLRDYFTTIYGNDGTEYRTENDIMARIVLHGSANSKQSWFEVQTKDGLTMEYGRTADSKMMLQENDTVVMWMLNKIKDLEGNYVTYKYTTFGSNKEYCMEGIEYTGNETAGITPTNKIQFSYSEREDDELLLIGNNTYVVGHRLDRITAKAGNIVTHDYTFTYENPVAGDGALYSRLTSIGLTVCDGKEQQSLNPTTIKWGGEGTNFTTQEFNGGDINEYIDESALFVGDFNGDGFDDIVKFHVDTDNPRWEYHKNNGSGQFEYTGVSFEIFDDLITAYPFDFNGDGLCDIIVTYDDGDGIVKIKPYLSDGDNFTALGDMYCSSRFPQFRALFPGDFDGDGIIDFIAFEKKTGPRMDVWKLCSYSLDEKIFTETTLHVPNDFLTLLILTYGSIHAIGDFNGDGKADILTSLEETSFIYTLKDHNLEKIYQGGYPTRWHEVFTGDFNGDGKTDLLTWAKDASPRWQVSLWKSHGFYYDQFYIPENLGFYEDDPGAQHPSLSEFSNSTKIKYNITTGDFNGDGKTDIMFVKDNLIKIYYTPLHLSRQNFANFANTETFETYIQENEWCNVIGNFRGDGKMTLIGKKDDGECRMYCFNNSDMRNTVSSIKDGLGNETKIFYLYLSNPAFCETEPKLLEYNASPTYVRHQALTMRAVRSINTKNLFGDNVYAIYSYANACLHLRGRGLLGFEKISIYNSLSNILTETECGLSSAVPVMVTKKVSEFVGDDAKTLVSEKELYHQILFQTKATPFRFPHVVQLQKEIVRRHDVSDGKYIGCTVTEYEYDSNLENGIYGFNNMTSKSTGYHNVNWSQKDGPLSVDACPFQEKETIQYMQALTNNGQWIVSRPKSVTTSSYTKESHDGIDNNVKQEVRYEYHPEKPHLISAKHIYPNCDANSQNAVTIKYQYEFDGDMVEKCTETRFATNQPETAPRTQTTTYGSEYRHMFPTVISNSLEYQTIMGYDAVLGRKMSETDCNGLVTSYLSNPVGTSIETVTPEGLRTMSVKRWCNTENGTHPDAPSYHTAVYYVWTKTSGEQPSITFYSSAGLELRTMMYGFNDEKIYIDKLYNERDLVKKVSNPYRPDIDTPVYTLTEYDRLGRPVCVRHPGGLIETTQYGKDVVTVTLSDGKSQRTSTQKNYGNGQVMESTDSGGNRVSYVYNSDGTLHSATVNDNKATTVTMMYNDARMRTSINDPDYGRIEYEFNAFGETTSQKTPNNIRTTYEFDRLGRMTKMTEDNGKNVVEWDYENSVVGKKGTLKSIIQNRREVMSYVYDDMLRLVKTTETVDGSKYVSEYTYDSFGRTKSETAPSGYVVSYVYDDNGLVKRIHGGEQASTLWKATQANAAAQITAFSYGNGSSMTRSFDSDTHRLEKIQAGVGGKSLQDIQYKYDVFGNLTSRTGQGGTTRSETFSYDNLDRLTKTSLSGISNVIQYDDLGRIESKEADGHVVFEDADYSGNKPHAVKTAKTQYIRPFISDQTISYTSFDKVKTIKGGSKTLSITYGYDHQRRKSELSTKSTKRTKIYVSNCEFVSKTGQSSKILTFLTAPTGIFAVVETCDNSTTLHYVYTDHLGSWNVIADAEGNIEQRLNYDAWGNIRNTDKSNTDFEMIDEARTVAPMFDRGFTGHEHLTDFGLINMNGRMYDPVMSMFLSPDNYIQAPDNSQSFNRYAYCLNNPLKYTDPNGELFLIDDIIIGAFVGAFIGGSVNATLQNLAGNANVACTFGIGALAGIAGVFAGGAAVGLLPEMTSGFYAGAVMGAASGAAGGFIGGAGTAWCGSASFGDGLMTGLKNAGVGAVIGGTIGGVSRGLQAYTKGFSFWNGCRTDEFVVGNLSAEEFANYENLAKKYNDSDNAIYDEELLQGRISDLYKTKVGDWSITKITPQTRDKYGMTSEGLYISKDGKLVGGFCHSNDKISEVHISPHFVNASDVDFQAVAGHELIHAYHHHTIPGCMVIESEKAAYHYTHDVYSWNGEFLRAVRVLYVASDNNFFWGNVQSTYEELPKIFSVKIF